MTYAQYGESIKRLVEELADEKVFFFVGAGVSFASRVPSVVDVSNGTCNGLDLKVQFSDNPSSPITEHDRFTIRPNELLAEQFYEQLLAETNGDQRCLGMWKCMQRSRYEEDGYSPRPDYTHLFIVAYSFRAGLPIFTTNYDSMFEMACEQLDLKYTVTTGYPNGSCEIAHCPIKENAREHASKERNRHVLICKLHGSIPDSGDITDRNIATTMNSITSDKPYCCECIKHCLSCGKHICFAGYSGRDCDLFPHIRQMLEDEGKKPFWFVGPDWKPTSDKLYPEIMARESDWLIMRWPGDDDGLRSSIKTVFVDNGLINCLEHLGQNNKTHNDKTEHYKDGFLKQISKCMDPSHEIQIESQRLFAHLELNVQNNAALAKIVSERSHDGVPVVHSYDDILINLRYHREIGKIRDYREDAKELIALSIKSVREDFQRSVDGLAFGYIELVSSYYLDIPQHLGFADIPLKYKKYGLTLRVRVMFMVVNSCIALYQWLATQINRISRRKLLSTISRTGDLLEARIRALAVDVAVAKRIPILTRLLIYRLEIIKQEADRKLDAVDSNRVKCDVQIYLDRLSARDTEGHTSRVAYMIQSRDQSGISRAYRENSDAPDPFGMSSALQSKNNLNIIKSYLKKAASSSYFLSKDEKKDLQQAMHIVEESSASWHRVLSYLRIRHADAILDQEQ